MFLWKEADEMGLATQRCVMGFSGEELEALLQQPLHQLWKEKFLVPPEIELLVLLLAVPKSQPVPNSLWSPKKRSCLAVLGFQQCHGSVKGNLHSPGWADRCSFPSGTAL